MPKTQSLKPNFAALAFALDSREAAYPAGCNAHILPDGAFRSDDGRPASMTGGELMDWQLNAQIAADLIAALGNGRPILYDYEHRSLFGDSRAAGWIDRLVYVSGQGLFGHVDWTPDADRDIAKRIWRYSSPCFNFDPKTGAVTRLVSVALTNNPALGDLGAVMLAYQAALSKAMPVGMLANQFLTTAGSLPGSTNGDSDMDVLATLTAERDGLKTQLAVLTAERDAQGAKVVALTTERDALKLKVDAAEQEKAKVALAAETAKHAELLQAALSGDHPLLTPAQEPWAKKLSLAALTEYLDATKPLAINARQANSEGSGELGLSSEELAMCSKMGVTPEAFKKAKVPA